MGLKTITAETMPEALAKVKAQFGEDVMMVSQKAIKKKTLTSKGLYEIVIQVDDEVKPKKAKKQNSSFDNDVFLKLSEAAKEIDNISKSSNNKLSNNMLNNNNNSTTNTIEIKELQKNIQEISNNMKLLQSTIWDLNSSQRDNLIIPPEFSEIYAIAKNSGMSKQHLDEIMNLTLKHMPLKMRHNSITIKRYFNTLLRRIVPIRQERELSLGTKKIMMFIGPTGVGKTTTIAKLAARYAFQKQKKYKVGIITLDTYRIGAVEQLMTYARMMKLSIEAVVDPSDFVEALNKLRKNDIILIDTVGSSQHDKEKMDKIKAFLGIDTFASIDVNLVLSATTKFEDLKDIYNNFSFLNIDTLVFTKLDETMKIGNIFSLVYDAKKPISYFSVGQEVPDDLQVASGEFLIDKMLKEIK